MILLIEPNRKIRKRLCDLLSRERIISVGSYVQTLEMMCKFKNDFNIIISNIRVLKDILLRGTLVKLCQKLYINIPPMLVLYRRGDNKIKEELEKSDIQCRLIKFDRDDTSFPERYIQAVKELYPDVMADIKKATGIWLKDEESEVHIDPRKWLVEEGFLDAKEIKKIGQIAKDMEQIIPLMKEMLLVNRGEGQKMKQNSVQEADYKEMYFKLKQKYDELINYVAELVNCT